MTVVNQDDKGNPIDLAKNPSYNPSLHTALIVEPSVNAYFEFAVRSVVRQLSIKSNNKWVLHVMHSEVNSAYVHDCLSDLEVHNRVVFSLIPVSMHVVGEYNQMTKRSSFWERYKQPGSKVLLFQSDTVMLNSATSIDAFLGVDYVGAPWHNQWNDRLNELRAQPGGYFKAGVGNGGFSLRSGDVMYYIASKSGFGSPQKEQEDMFYVKQIEVEAKSAATLGSSSQGKAVQGVQRPAHFVVADRETAYKFAYEVKCDDLAGAINSKSTEGYPPLGLHAAWYYWSEGEMTKLLSFL
jgi:hypothetical protein